MTNGETILGKIVNLLDDKIVITTTKKGTIYILKNTSSGFVSNDVELDSNILSQSELNSGDHAILTSGTGFVRTKIK